MKNFLFTLLFNLYFTPFVFSQNSFEFTFPWGADTNLIAHTVLENPDGGYLVLSTLNKFIPGFGMYHISYGNVIHWLNEAGNIVNVLNYETQGALWDEMRSAQFLILAQDGDIIMPFEYTNGSIFCTWPGFPQLFYQPSISKGAMRINRNTGELLHTKIFPPDETCGEENRFFDVTLNSADNIAIFYKPKLDGNEFCVEYLDGTFETIEKNYFTVEQGGHRYMDKVNRVTINIHIDTIRMFDFDGNLLGFGLNPIENTLIKPILFKNDRIVFQAFSTQAGFPQPPVVNTHIITYSIDGNIQENQELNYPYAFDKMLITPSGNILAVEDIAIYDDDSIPSPLHVMLFDTNFQLIAENYYAYPYVSVRDMILTSDEGFLILGSFNGAWKYENKVETRSYILKQSFNDLVPVKNNEPDNNSELEYSISPNPVTSQVRYLLRNSNKSSYQLFDNQGRLLEALDDIGVSGEINLSNYQNGVYFLKIVDNENNRFALKKIVKL